MWKHLPIALSFLINKVKKRHKTVGFDTEDLGGGETDALTTYWVQFGRRHPPGSIILEL
jgi:hypothetical protein